MAKSVKLEIVTPEKRFYSGEVELVITRTLNGEEGFMANHTWGVKLLDVGELWIREPGADSDQFKLAAVGGGFIDVKDSIIIFAETFEWMNDVDVPRAEREKAEAEAWLEANADTAPGYEVKAKKHDLEKCKVRLKVAAGGRRAAKLN